MAKDLDIIQAVKDNDQQALLKLLQKCTKTPKNKIIGNTKKLNINFQDGDGMSALHQAALMSNTLMVKTLLDNGAISTLRDNKGMIPLHYATWQGMSQPVQLLIQRGSPVNEQALNGETPLHLACQHGHFDVGTHLLNQHADPTICNKELKTALDLACEYGRTRVTELLLRSNLCQKLLEDSPIDNLDNNRTTCLHLAARNGHCEIIKLLLQYGMNINRSTLKGTCLHEAAMAGKTDAVRLLLECGVDVNKPDSYDQTALDIVSKFTGSHGMKELKQMLKEASCAVYARAVRDFSNVYDPGSLAFKEGDIVSVLEQRPDGIWRGCVLSQGRRTKAGVFPANHVVLVDSKVVAQHLSLQQTPKAGQMYSQIPDLLNRGALQSGGGGGGGSLGLMGSPSHRGSCGSSGTEDGSTSSHPSTPHSIPTTPLGGVAGGGPGGTLLPSLMTSYPPPPRSPMTRDPSCADSGFSSSQSLPQHTPSSPAGSQQFQFGKVPFGPITSNNSNSGSPYHHGSVAGAATASSANTANGSIPNLQANGSIPGCNLHHPQHQQSLSQAGPNTHGEWGLAPNSTGHPHHHHAHHHAGFVGVASGEPGLRGISPAKDSPAHSNRNSAASSDSGRGFSTGHADHKPLHNYVNVHVTNAPNNQHHPHHHHHRLSGQSYESGVSLSRQSYHSTSSSSHGSLDRLEDPGIPSTINVTQLFQAGVPDTEVLHAWLNDLGFEEVYPLFLQAGYDMPTISRMTPEDLTAIGITKPAHRKRLKAEIARLHIHDGIPDYRPNDLMEWLHLLGLGAYLDTLCSQGYKSMDDVTDITWEDLEEIGIQKLGHQKKIMLAIDRLKRITQGSKRLSSMDGRTASLELLEPPPPAPPMSARWSGEITAIPSHVYDHGALGHHGGSMGLVGAGGARPKKSSSGDSISTTSSGNSGSSTGNHVILGGEMRIIPLPREDAGGMAGAMPFRQNSTSNAQPDVVAIQVKRPLRGSTSSMASDDTNRNSTGSGGGGSGGNSNPGMYKSFHGTPHQRRPSDSGGEIMYSGSNDSNNRYQYSNNKMSMSDYESRKEIIAYAHAQQQQQLSGKDGSVPASVMMSQSAHSSIPGVGVVSKEHIYATPQLSPTSHNKMFAAPGATTSAEALSGPLHINTGLQSSSNQSTAQRSPARNSGAKKIPPPPPKRTHSIREGGSLSDSPGGSPAPASPKPHSNNSHTNNQQQQQQQQNSLQQVQNTPAIPPFPKQQQHLSSSGASSSTTAVAAVSSSSLPSTELTGTTTSAGVAVSSTITVSASIHPQPSSHPSTHQHQQQQQQQQQQQHQQQQHMSPSKQQNTPPPVSSKPQIIKASSPPVVAAKPSLQQPKPHSSPAVAPKPLSPKPVQSPKMTSIHTGENVSTSSSSSPSSSSSSASNQMNVSISSSPQQPQLTVSVPRSPAISIPKPSSSHSKPQQHHSSSSSPSLSQSPRASGILLSSSPGRSSHLSERLSKSPPVVISSSSSSSLTPKSSTLSSSFTPSSTPSSSSTSQSSSYSHPQQQQQQLGVDKDQQPQQQGKGFASCVKSLSEKFGKNSGGEGTEKDKNEEEDQFPDNVSTDSDDFPPPPPPIAMDIITPKIHNYGIPSSRERSKPGFGLAAHQRDIPPTQRRNFSSTPGIGGVMVGGGGGLDTGGPRRINPGVTLPKDEKASSMLSARLPPDQSNSPGNQMIRSGGIGNKPYQHTEHGGVLIKPNDHHNQQKQYQLQQQQQQQMQQQPHHTPSKHQQQTPRPQHQNSMPDSNSTAVPTSPSNPTMGDNKRSDSTMSFESTSSSSSMDSNTLPFANENVGTIKQRAPPMTTTTSSTPGAIDTSSKPSAGESKHNGQKNVDLNVDMYHHHLQQNNDSHHQQQHHQLSSSQHYTNNNSSAANSRQPQQQQQQQQPQQQHQQQQSSTGAIRPPVPSKKPTLSPKPARPTQPQNAPSSSSASSSSSSSSSEPASQPSAPSTDGKREGETGNVLCDIDNMLQDLTDELDAMLEEEVAS